MESGRSCHIFPSAGVQCSLHFPGSVPQRTLPGTCQAWAPPLRAWLSLSGFPGMEGRAGYGSDTPPADLHSLLHLFHLSPIPSFSHHPFLCFYLLIEQDSTPGRKNARDVVRLTSALLVHFPYSLREAKWGYFRFPYSGGVRVREIKPNALQDSGSLTCFLFLLLCFFILAFGRRESQS